MEQFTEYLNLIGSLGVIILQIMSVLIIVALLARRFSKQRRIHELSESILSIFSSHALLIGFLTALMSMIISLMYSDVIGYEPCKLCWVQRIFLYPQVVIFGLALWKKTRDSDIYCLFLSVIGAVIAGFHYYAQSFNPSALPACDAAGGASCAVRFFMEFGYVTIPLMSFTSFIFIILVIISARSK
ncbi:MAG: disulfide bond formation protein B [Candidatus Taylorbacteria bacterium]|nr:disulfide bond formation protein B [Candidatus Taylorbacteria bacterium]